MLASSSLIVVILRPLMIIMLLVLVPLLLLLFQLSRSFAFSILRSLGRARRQPLRPKIPCWPLPPGVTARSPAQPSGSAFENANQRRTT